MTASSFANTGNAWKLVTDEFARDNASPRVTFYERTPGPTDGERIELSGKVLLNWVSKAANLLVEEFDVGTGTQVGLYLPGRHWRAHYWALAAWACGAELVFADCDSEVEAPEADVLITCCPQPDVEDQIVVTLAALARSATQPVPVGAFDEAKELSTYPDVFHPLTTASPSDAAYRDETTSLTYAQLTQGQQTARAYLPNPTPADVFAHLAGGSGVVLVRGADVDVTVILAQEGLA